MNSRKKRRDAITSKNMHWQDVWNLPLKLDEYSGTYAWDTDNVMALSFNWKDRIPTAIRQDIINAINGEDIVWPESWKHNGGDFFLGDKYVFCVRGWGHLIGCGALHLPEDEAARIQDEFIEYIFNCLNK